MTSVKGVPAGRRDEHFAVLAGTLLAQIRATLAAEDWGGLRQSHFRLLGNVPGDGISVTDLSERLGMTKQATGQFVTSLERSGHLQTRPDPRDGRVRKVLRTPAGDATHRAVTARVRRIERGWARQVGAGKYAVFREVLESIVHGDQR